MQKSLLIKLSLITSLCIAFLIGLSMLGSLVSERQHYADSVINDIAEQHVYPQQVINPFIIIPTTTKPICNIDMNAAAKTCVAPYTTLETVFPNQTRSTQDIEVSTNTYKRGIYHATSYEGQLHFNQHYNLPETLDELETKTINDAFSSDSNNQTAKTTDIHTNQIKLIIPISDLRGVSSLPVVAIDGKNYKATYPKESLLGDLSYVELNLSSKLGSYTSDIASIEDLYLDINNSNNEDEAVENEKISDLDSTPKNSNRLEIKISTPLSGISNLATIPTGQNFELNMVSNWPSPNFIGKALPNSKDISNNGFNAKWQNQYLTVANNHRITSCINETEYTCNLQSNFLSFEQLNERYDAVEVDNSSPSINSFVVNFADPNDVYLQTERTMKYALLLILVSFATFFLFEIIKSNRIHPIQYMLVGSALVVFYILLLPLAEQIAFWQAYAIAASACVGLIGWYSSYVLGSIKRALIFTAILGGLYAAFFGILTTEDMNLLLGAIFCFVLLAGIMIMTRKIDWYKIA